MAEVVLVVATQGVGGWETVAVEVVLDLVVPSSPLLLQGVVVWGHGLARTPPLRVNLPW